MAMMTMLRNRMHVVLWALLVLFLLSMTVGGLVGGANIIDQLLGRVNPAEAIGLVNGQKITPNQFNQAVNAQMDAIRNSGSQISDQDLERVRSQVWNGFIEEYLTKEAIEDLDSPLPHTEIVNSDTPLPKPSTNIEKSAFLSMVAKAKKTEWFFCLTPPL